MKRVSVLAVALSLLAAGCGSSSPSSPSTTNPTFTADLRPANEVPPITDAESSGSGTATITIDATRDANNNITAATVTFVVTLQNFPPGTPVNIAHIHQAAAGSIGPIVVNTTLGTGEVTLANGSGFFTKTGLPITSLDLANQIIANPAGFYFNVHSTLHPTGVARGQLVRVQ